VLYAQQKEWSRARDAAARLAVLSPGKPAGAGVDRPHSSAVTLDARRVGVLPPTQPRVSRRRKLFHGDLDASVPCSAFLRPVAGDRLGLSPTLRRDPR